jgi:hypothetical protein
MAIIILFLILRRAVSLYGFDFYSDRNNPHYFDSNPDIFLGHEIQYEKFFFGALIQKNFMPDTR